MADGGQQPGNRADEQGCDQAADPGFGGDDDLPAPGVGVDAGGDGAEDDPHG